MPPAIAANRLCLAVARPTLAEMLGAVQRARTLADVVEIRLDALKDRHNLDQAIHTLLAESPLPLLFTNRPTWEGGAAAEPEEERVRPLLTALAAGAAYVDIELRTAPELRPQVIAASGDGATGGRVIVSWHDFQSTPAAPALTEILARMRQSGADIGKIVTMTDQAAGPAQVRRLLALLEEAAAAEFPLIAFCMGEAGKISRLATGFLGGYMTYAAETDGTTTAPGQLSAAALRRAEKILSGDEP